jgi:branched-chain amino acid transport system permease protein
VHLSQFSPKMFTTTVVAIALMVPLFVTNTYFMHVLVIAGVYVILALSLNLLTGYSGLLSLGHQAFFGIGAYTSALLASRLDMPFVVGLLGGGAMAMVSGYFISRITLRLRDAYFVIATIAFSQIIGLIANNWMELTQGPLGITNLPPPSLLGFTADTPVKGYYMVLALIAFSVFICRRLIDSDVGRSLIAMREFENLARAVGVDTRKYAMVASAVSAMLAGIAGAFYAHYLKFLSPDVFSFEVMINIVVMMLAGGMGTLVGPVLGAAIFTVVPEALRFSKEYRMVLYALAIILLVRFLPRGLWGIVVDAVRNQTRRNDVGRGNKPPPAAGGGVTTDA